MLKKGKKLREIRFHSAKNNSIVIVHTEQELKYAQKLEEDGSVVSYTYAKPIDKILLSKISKVDIRGAFFKDDWLTDFYIISTNGSISIREICTERDLTRLAEVEKLELSRRYWSSLGVADWKIVLG